MKKCAALIMVMAIGGCTYQVAPVTEEAYTKAQVDAIGAEASCKRMARNLVEIARCEPGRR